MLIIVFFFFFLIFISVQPLKIGANVLMILLMGNDVLAHFQVKDGIERMGLPIVFILLLSCRLLITVQEKAREASKAKEEKEKQTEEQSMEETTTQEDQNKTAEEKKTQ